MSGETRSVVVRLSMDTAQAIRASKQFGSEFDRALSQAERRSMSTGRAIDDIGGKAGKMALASVGALAMMGKAALDWESQWAGVSKTVDGTASQLNDLEGDLRGLARTMPATHQEIAATAEAAGQLGVATGDVADFTKVMIQLGETTNLTSDGAATSIAQLMNVLGTMPDKVDEIGNTLVDLGNKGASTEGQILDMAQRLAGAGALVGASESDVLGLASAMANLGIQSELGGGAMQRVFTMIYTAAKDGGDQLEGFATLAGMSADQFADAWSSDPMRAFDALIQGMGGVQDSGGNLIERLDELGIKGTQNLQVILRLAGSGDMLTDSLDQSSAAWEQNTALTDEYGKRAETTASQIQVSWNKIKDAGIEGGEAILPVLAEVADTVGTVADAFGQLPDPVQSSLTKLLALSAIVGGGVWVGSKIYSFIQTTRDSLDALTRSSDRSTTSLGRMARTAGGIVAVAGAVTVLGNALADATGAKIDSSDLQRDLEALANGNNSDLLNRISEDMEILGQKSGKLAEPLYEAGTAFGLFGNTGNDNAADNIEQVDQALAAMVESGNAEEAEAIFARIASAVTGMPEGSSFNPAFLDGFGSYSTALDNAAAAAPPAADATGELAGATDALGGSAAGAAADIDELIVSMHDQRDAALGAFDAETQYRQALKEAQAQARKSEAGIRGNSEAALDNRSALSSLAAAWNGQSKAVKNNENRFRESRRAFIDTATAMGVPEQAARDLAKRILDIPDSAVIKIHADSTQAHNAITSVGSWLEQLDGKVARTYIDTIQRSYSVKRDNIAAANAMGGYYPKVSAYAAGGMDVANAHQPEITRGGPIRVWSEPETGGEAYIPLANDGRRPRARAILGQTAMALGGEVSWRRSSYAPSGGGAAGGGGSRQMRITGRLDTAFGPSDIVGIATEVARSEIDAEARFTRVKAGGTRG